MLLFATVWTSLSSLIRLLPIVVPVVSLVLIPSLGLIILIVIVVVIHLFIISSLATTSVAISLCLPLSLILVLTATTSSIALIVAGLGDFVVTALEYAIGFFSGFALKFYSEHLDRHITLLAFLISHADIFNIFGEIHGVLTIGVGITGDEKSVHFSLFNLKLTLVAFGTSSEGGIIVIIEIERNYCIRIA